MTHDLHFYRERFTKKKKNDREFDLDRDKDNR